MEVRALLTVFHSLNWVGVHHLGSPGAIPVPMDTLYMSLKKPHLRLSVRKWEQSAGLAQGTFSSRDAPRRKDTVLWISQKYSVLRPA